MAKIDLLGIKNSFYTELLLLLLLFCIALFQDFLLFNEINYKNELFILMYLFILEL